MMFLSELGLSMRPLEIRIPVADPGGLTPLSLFWLVNLTIPTDLPFRGP